MFVELKKKTWKERKEENVKINILSKHSVSLSSERNSLHLSQDK